MDQDHQSAQGVRVATLQPALRWQQAMSNMMTLRQAVESLPQAVDLVVFPEAWLGLPLEEQDTLQEQALQFLQNLARSRAVSIIGGTIVQRDEHGEPQLITPVIQRGGALVGAYAKQVPFGREQDLISPGSTPGIFEVDGARIGVLICADLWHGELAQALRERIDVLCVPAKTTVPTQEHVFYARRLWHSLALTRAMENGYPVVVSDWATGRHKPKDVDQSVGSAHAPGTTFDRGVLHKRHRDRTTSPTASGPTEPTATAHSSIEPATWAGVFYTAGGASVCNPGQRPEMHKVQQTFDRGEAGNLIAWLDPAEQQNYRQYRRSVGLLGPATAVSPASSGRRPAGGARPPPTAEPEPI